MRLARVFGLVATGVMAAMLVAGDPVKAPAKADPPPEAKGKSLIVKTVYTVPAGQSLRVYVSGGVVGHKADFTEDQAFFDEYGTQGADGRRYMFQSVTPGKYTIVFWGKDDTAGASTTITVEGKAPINEDTQGPKDPKKPTGKAAQLIVVYDTSNISHNLLVKVYTSDDDFFRYYSTVWKTTARPGVGYIDVNPRNPKKDTPAQFAKLLDEAKGKELPYYFVIADDGSIRDRGLLPPKDRKKDSAGNLLPTPDLREGPKEMTRILKTFEGK